MDTQIIIMAGGVGSRFWSMSTPDYPKQFIEMSPSFYTDKEKEVVGKLFPTCEKISIDYAVMEKSKEFYTLPAEF